MLFASMPAYLRDGSLFCDVDLNAPQPGSECCGVQGLDCQLNCKYPAAVTYLCRGCFQQMATRAGCAECEGG